MSSRKAPPNSNPIVSGDGLITIPWAEFMDGVYRGDTGTAWTPEFVALSSTGTPTISGRYYKISSSLIYFRITIIPATNTSAISGTTYVQNMPFTLVADASCSIIAPPVSEVGACASSNNRIYVTTWTNITVPITVTGLVEAR